MYFQAKHNIKNSTSSERGNVQNTSQWKNKVIAYNVVLLSVNACYASTVYIYEVYTECVYNVYIYYILLSSCLLCTEVYNATKLSRSAIPGAYEPPEGQKELPTTPWNGI